MRQRLLGASALAVLLGGLASACTDDEPSPLELSGPPAQITMVSGDHQIGRFEQSLPAPLVIAVRDANGQPVPARQVVWSTSGGTLSSLVDSTDGSGLSSVTWSLPATPGNFTASATVAGLGSVGFTALATPVGHLVTFRYVDAGSYHGCGITTTEELLCWGYNGEGQLGVPPGEALSWPNLIPFEQRFRSVSGGRYHTCGVTLSGGVQCWGQNRDNRAIPGDPVSFQAVEAGLTHTCALNMARKVFCWGYNGEGQLGNGRRDPQEVVDSLSLVGEQFRHLAVGGLHSCGVKENGTAWCWGFNAEGQVGSNGAQREHLLETPVLTATLFAVDPIISPPHPDPDSPLPPGPFLAAGFAHTCGIGTDLRAWCWGLNEFGQLGTGGLISSGIPVQVTGPANFVRITAGYSHTCGLTMEGRAFCWGDNSFGQLGDGTVTRRLSPTAVAGDLTFSYLKAGDLSTCGVTTSGVGYCWGNNEYGQLGNGTRGSSVSPTKVAFQQ